MATDTQGNRADVAHATASRQLERLVDVRASLDAAQDTLASMRADDPGVARAHVNDLDRIIATARRDLTDLTVALRSALADLRAATSDEARARGHRY